MFDMNLLWEQFVLVSLKKNKSIRVKGQNSKYFWKPAGGRRRSIRPDITVFDGENNFVLDTKWKLVDRKPSMDDIRQMYVYHHYFNAAKVALLYPGVKGYIAGKYTDADNHGSLSDNECGLMFTEFSGSVKKWQEQIGEEVMEWIKK
jgi:5-methylcytosine-specific restriction enzyme subunit McrC